MKIPKEITNEMIATCGINCLACSAYLGNRCNTCHTPIAKQKRKSCRNCLIKSCALSKGFTWCFQCDEFPCEKTSSLFKRYKKNFNIDLIQDGLEARKDLSSFLNNQKEHYTCRICGGIVNLHHRKCSECNDIK